MAPGGQGFRHRGIAEIAVDQQHPPPLLGKGYCQIHGDGGLALAGDGAGDQQNFLPVLLHGLLHPQTEQTDGFGEAGLASVPVQQRIRPLPGYLHRGDLPETGGVQGLAQLVLVVDGVLHQNQKRQNHAPDCRAHDCAAGDIVPVIELGDGRGGHTAFIQQHQHRGADYELRHLRVAGDHGAHDVICTLGVGIPDLQRQDAGLRRGRDGHGRHLVDPQLVHDPPLQQPAGEDGGEGIRHDLRRFFVVAADAGVKGVGHPNREGGAGLVDGPVGSALHKRQSGGADQDQRQTQQPHPLRLMEKVVQQYEGVPPLLFRFFDFHSSLPISRSHRNRSCRSGRNDCTCCSRRSSGRWTAALHRRC